MNLEPMNDRVLIRQEEAATEVGGMLLPEQEREKRSIGTVIAIGPDVMDKNSKVEDRKKLLLGDRIVFAKYSPIEMDEFGKGLALIRFEQVHCKIVETES